MSMKMNYDNGCEVRCVIRFLNTKNMSASEIYRECTKVWLMNIVSVVGVEN